MEGETGWAGGTHRWGAPSRARECPLDTNPVSRGFVIAEQDSNVRPSSYGGLIAIYEKFLWLREVALGDLEPRKATYTS
jgi:hypothetical protein